VTDAIHLPQPDGQLIEVVAARYDAEADPQRLLATHPTLIPGAQITPEVPRRHPASTEGRSP